MNKKKTYDHGFKVPKKYFENFEDQIFNRLKEDSIPKSTGFDIPDGYLASFEDRLMEKIQEETQTARVVPLFKRKSFLYGLSIAASLLLLVSLVFKNPSSDYLTLDELEISTIENYVDEDMDWDTYDIAAIAEEEDFTNLITDYDYISDESLENYLLESLDDNTLIIEQE